MKNLLFLTAFTISSNIYASQITNINSLSNTLLESVTNKIIGTELVTHSTRKKVVVLKGKGKTAQEIRQNTLAQAAHTICPFFDDGVAITLNTKDDKGSMRAVSDLADSSNINSGDPEYNTLLKSITAANKIPTVELYSGSASGNNTSGTILGFYDLVNNEMAVFSNTNCGSDN